MTKTIVLTGGGTAGHVTPNMALLPFLRKDGWRIHYIGTHSGIERSLIEPLCDVTYHAISSGKLRRYFSLKNFSDPFRVLRGMSQSRALMRELQPNVIFAKGGFVCVPVVYAAKSCNVPVVLHESDYTCGLANKLCAPKSQTVCVSFEPTLQHVKGNKGVWTGSPIRQSLLQGQFDRAQLFCHFPEPQKPWILFMGGSLGSAALNEAVKQSLTWLCERYNVVHIRGKGNLDASLSHESYRQYEFVGEEMADLYAASALVVCRSGANTLFELLALCKPSVLVPLPAAQSRGDQILNARYFEKLGYAHVLMQEVMTAEALQQRVLQAFCQIPSMQQAMAQSPMKDGTQNVLKEIYSAAGVSL